MKSREGRLPNNVDLTPFRQKFAGDDKTPSETFDAMAARLVKLVFHEAALR
jgi:hypothetical protein